MPINEPESATYTFGVVVEPDEHMWAACCPALLSKGAATWGRTRAEALRNIHEATQMVVDSLRAANEPLPIDVGVSKEPLVSVTV